jgi:hypothetical protein
MLYNGDDFTDTVGWTAWKRVGEENKDCWTIESVKKVGEANENEYYMKVTTNKDDTGKLLNDTCAETNQQISADTPYVFRYNAEKNGSYIKKLSIYSKNPLANYGIAPDYTISFSGKLDDKGVVIKSKKSFSTPFFVFELSGDIVIKSIEFFPLQGTTEDNNLTLLRNYPNGKTLSGAEGLFILPDESSFSAYTEHKVQYFIRDNYGYSLKKTPSNEYIKNTFVDLNLKEKTVTYFDFKEEINVEGNKTFYITDSNIGKEPLYKIFTPVVVNETLANLNEPPYVVNNGNDGNNAATPQIDTKTIFLYEGKYYQYYYLQGIKGFKNGGAWDYAFLGSGDNGKRRTYSVSKSNHFNIIQDIAELFKVWPVFETTREKNGIIRKQFYFKEEALKENFSGFHRGINLVDLTRRMDSENIVTKIYVEDQENQHAKDGFVTIRTSKFNPWGENYYYNFQYYVNQQLMNVTDNGTPLVERDMKILYSEVKGLNNEIYKLNTENADLIVEIKNLKNRQKTLTLQIAGQEERIASSQADLDATKSSDTDKKLILGPTDIQTLNDNISAGKDNIKKWEDELSSVTLQLKELQDRYDGNKTTVEKNQKNKENLIDEFESKYRPYIKEGVWFDNSYIENDAYFIDSQKVMNTSSKPQLEWTINVIDGSIATELENFEFEVGDKTILVDNEFFGIEKNGEENYVFEVLISGIKEGLDDATKNTIEVRNYNTSFEELFERISAATQTLELNEQTYNKSAYFTSDGELSADILQKTLIQNSLILANASDNSYILDNSGLTLRSILNPRKQLRLIAEGLFLSNSTNLATGAPEWKTGITADGISASLLTAGEINTANIKIFTGGQPNQTWNALGITSYRVTENWEKIDGKQTLVSKEIDSDRFVRFDNFGFYFMDHPKENFNLLDGNLWFEGLSRESAIEKITENAALSITEKGFRLNLSNTQILEGVFVYQTDNITIGEIEPAEYLKEVEYKAYGIHLKGSFDYVASEYDSTQTDIRLSTDGESYIGNWHFQSRYIVQRYNWDPFKQKGRSFQLSPDGLTLTNYEQHAIGTPGEASYHHCQFSIAPLPYGGLEKDDYQISGSITNGFLIKQGSLDLFSVNKDRTFIEKLSATGATIQSLECAKTTCNATFTLLSKATYSSGKRKTENQIDWWVDTGLTTVGNCYLRYTLSSTDDIFRIGAVYKDNYHGWIDFQPTCGLLGGTWFSSSSISTISDQNKKNTIQKISDNYSDFYNLLSPVTYKYNDGTSDRKHIGFIAQQVKECLDKSGIDTKDFAGLVIDKNDNNETWYLRYEEFIALNTHEIQKLKKEIDDLKKLLTS